MYLLNFLLNLSALCPYKMDMKQISPRCGPDALAKRDGRTREAKLIRQVREELIAHVGGKPSATQRALIERAVNLSIRIAIMDERFAETGHQTELDSRTYLAWSNTLTRTIRSLGLKGPASRTPTLADYIAAKPESEAA